MISTETKPDKGWRRDLHIIIFEAETPAGKAFDVALLWIIILSIAVVMLESVADLQLKYGDILRYLEWVLTLLFTVEYIARLITVRHPFHYAFSFFGIVDLLALLPTYIGMILTGGQYLMVIRTLRLLRVFRIFKLGRYVGEGHALITALKASSPKIVVFLMTVMSMVTILGTLMYMVEGGINGFTSIPRSIYWAIVTLTTVGYGDIAPKTVLGQSISSVIMILGYAIIALPTGMVTAELTQQAQERNAQKPCHHCQRHSRSPEDDFCRFCGQRFL